MEATNRGGGIGWHAGVSWDNIHNAPMALDRMSMLARHSALDHCEGLDSGNPNLSPRPDPNPIPYPKQEVLGSATVIKS